MQPPMTRNRKFDRGNPDQSNDENSRPPDILLQGVDNFYSSLCKHEGDNNKADHPGIAFMPTDEFFVFDKAEAGINDELDQPNKGHEPAINDDLSY